MSEEKKDEVNEQQTFLSGHEELLKSINNKKETPEEPVEPTEEVVSTPEADTEDASITAEIPVPDSPDPIGESATEEALVPASEPEPAEEVVSTPEADAQEVPAAEEDLMSESPDPIEESADEEEHTSATEPEPIVETPVEKTEPKPQEPAGEKEEKRTPQQHKHSPRHEEVLKQKALEQQEVKEVLVFFRKYAKPAGIVIVAVCALVLADKFLKSQRHKKEAAADTALMNARSAEDLQDIVNDYASTPTGPMALMELAREKFNAGQFDEAEELYTKFTKQHAEHELATQAALNLITCKEAKGQFGEAHLLYGQFAKKHEGAYLAPSAMIGQARCLEALDQLDEAQIAYEDVIVNYPETGWSRIAEANLKVVLGKKQ